MRAAGTHLHLAVPKTADFVVIDHPHRLHERVADRGADEAEAALLEALTHRVRLCRARRKLAQRAERIPLWRAANELPDVRIERAEFLAHLADGLRIPDRR